MRQVGLSFDDGLLDQFKWARTMNVLGLRGVFYISPGRVGGQLWLQEWQLEQMTKEWGMVIGNHTWDHECPRTKDIGEKETLESIERAGEWLEKRGYASKLFALTYGTKGGGWKEEFVGDLQTKGYVLRDVRFEGEAANGHLLPSALESATPTFADAPDLRYFHGNHVTSDDEMARLLYAVAEKKAAGELTLLLPQMGEKEWLSL